jgi:hypothetical protein
LKPCFIGGGWGLRTRSWHNGYDRTTPHCKYRHARSRKRTTIWVSTLRKYPSDMMNHSPACSKTSLPSAKPMLRRLHRRSCFYFPNGDVYTDTSCVGMMTFSFRSQESTRHAMEGLSLNGQVKNARACFIIQMQIHHLHIMSCGRKIYIMLRNKSLPTRTSKIFVLSSSAPRRSRLSQAGESISRRINTR